MKKDYRMRLIILALCSAVAGASLCGCAGNFADSTTSFPSAGSRARTPAGGYLDAPPARSVQVLHELVFGPNAEPTSGIYVSQFDGIDVLGYPAANTHKNRPICKVSGGLNVNGVAVDGNGNLVVPSGAIRYVIVFKGPEMCGRKLGSFADKYGQPFDASSANAVTGKIAVSNIRDHGGKSPGSLSICTLRGGCTSNLTNSKMYAAGGVAMSNTGDCWVDAKTSYVSGAALIYFQGCQGQGQVAGGFKNTSYGGIDIDDSGNLVTIEDDALAVYIYSGCKPACTVVGGPYSLKAESFFGKLNAANSDYAAVNLSNGAVDMYSYSTRGIEYEYSFKNGLSAGLEPEGIAQNPRSMQ
jgi:hypothetical protein